MTPPLKPCPFCRNAPKSYQSIGWLIACDAPECHVRPYVIAETESIAIEKWEWRGEPSIEEGAARRHQEGRTT